MIALAGLILPSPFCIEGEREENEMGREKTSSIDLLQQSYHSLTSKKIKNTLSSFLPDIPGECTHQ